MKILVIISTILLLTGCATDYPCGEPRAGRCSSVSDNIQKSTQPVVNPEDLPINPYENCSSGKCGSNTNLSNINGFSKYPKIPSNGSPLVSTPTMMRMWIAPYVDVDNIYHEQNYQYMLVDRGHWLNGANSFFGRSDGYSQNKTTLIQDTNDVVQNSGQSGSQQNNNQTTTSNGTANNTPALNFLKQQDQATVTSMGMGKQ